MFNELSCSEQGLVNFSKAKVTLRRLPPIPPARNLPIHMNPISLRVIVDEAPIVAIVRRPKVDPIRCIEHLFQHGIRLIEITMDSMNAADVLKHFRSRVPANCLLGAGTVTSVSLAETALEAGASFIVARPLNHLVRSATQPARHVEPNTSRS